MVLTRREREVAELVAEGLSNRAIARRLFIDERTVEDHVRHALGRLGFENRTQLAAWVAAGGGSGEAESRLPQPLTRFVGRTREVAEIRELLGRRRLVTLTGAGGVGKTRLALAAAGFGGRFSRAVMADLSVVATSDRVVAEVAQAVTDGKATDEASLLAKLDRAVSLLLLDNCEHLVEATAQLALVLLRRTKVVILATSRVPLEVESEAVYPVAPMAAHEAVELFQDRAEPEATSVEEAAAVCHRVDRLPLAVELAAARTRVMSPQALIASLDASLAMLSGGSRSAPDRLRSVEASIGWSYRQLDAADRAGFRALGTFEGSFDLEAATAVTGAPPTAVLGLVDRSLLVRAGPDAYRLLFPVREFARARLAECGDQVVAEDRHDAWVAALVRSCQGAAIDRDWQQARRLWEQRDEIWPALERLRDRDRPVFVEIAPVFALPLPDFGLRVEAVRLAEQAVALARPGDPGYASAHLLCGALITGYTGDHEAALPLLVHALESAEAAGDDAISGRAQFLLATTHAMAGRYQAALDLLERAKARLGDSLSPSARAVLLNAEGMNCWHLGRFEEGVEAARGALALSAGNIFTSAPLSDTLARNLAGLGRHHEALAVMREAARAVREHELVGQAVVLLTTLARIALALADAERAAVLTAAAESWAERIGQPIDWYQPDAGALLSRHPEAAELGRRMDWREALELPIG